MTKTSNTRKGRVTALVSDVLLGCNPAPAPGTGGWSGRTGRVFDMLLEDYGPGDWSLSCHDGVLRNSRRVVGPGTIGWIYRSNGDWGHLAGIAVFIDQPHLEVDGEVYCDCTLFPLPVDWWLEGDEINAAGWSNRAPWGDTTPRRCQNGEELSAADTALLERLIHPVARAWVQDHRKNALR
jgi:hypothetical protein